MYGTKLSIIGLMRNSVSTELFRVSAMAKLNEYLILTQSQVSTKKFPNLPNKKFIALAVIEKEYVNRENADAFTKGTLHGHPDEILKKKEPIILEAVLEPPEGQRNVKLVFVEGAPGVGKSTLALELCRRQKEIKAMAKYSLVLLFQLRDKDVQGIQMIEGLFHHDDISLQRSVTKEVIDCNGKDVLFILDGFDELPSNLRQDSFFVKLIQGKHLPASTVLVTSRPSASAEILQSVNDYKYIEVLGFTQNQVEQYARSMLNDQPDVLKDFLKYIFVNPAIRGMMYVPLNSAIVLHIYRKNRTKSKTFPRTMTQLYTELCLVLLIKYLKEKNESDPLITDLLNTTDLGDLPESIKDQIFMLGELAFKGALSQEITFERLPKGCDDLGLLNVSTGLYLGRKSYSFLHLTLQEFLAGYYFSHLSPVEQELKFVNNLMLNDIRSKSGIKLGNHLNVMWRFVAGLNGFKNIGWGLVYDASNWCRTDYDRKDMRCTPFLIRCLFEVQDVKEIKSACDSIFVTSECPNINLCFSNHLDCYAAGYCIAVSGQKWNLNLSYIEGDEVLEMLCCGLKSAVNISGSILDLDLAGNSLTAAAMSYLRELQTIGILPQIHLLSLRGNKLNNCAFDDFAEIVTSMVNLTCLQVGDNLVEESGMVKFFQNLSQISTLTELHMADINLGFTDIQALSEMMASIKYLTKLSIGDPRMSDKSVIEMVKVLLSPTSLKEVTFRGVFWTCKRAENFALLKQNNNIATLTFERNYDYSFHLDPVIPAIAEALHVNKSLQVLKMPPRYSHDDAEEDVHIRHESIVALSTMLRVNKTLKRLDIFASLACDDIAFLSDALRFNYTLQTLNVSNKRINISHYSDSDED